MAHSARADIARFLAEDIGRGDITSALLSKKRITGCIVSKEPAVLAGVEFAATAFRLRRCTVAVGAKDGGRIRAGRRIMRVSGTPQGVLSAERTALNLLCRMSGIATKTRRLAGMLRGTKAGLYATRKTAPGLSFFDKEAVLIGGGSRHRSGLDDMVLIKDNHIAAAQASGMTLDALVRRAVSRHKIIEVEVETVHDARIAAEAGARIIMLDNFTPSGVRRTIKALEKDGVRKRVKLEASGRIGAHNIAAFGATGVDRISVGSITSSARSIDMSLEVS